MKHEFNHKAAVKEIKDFLYSPLGTTRMCNYSRLDFIVLILQMIVYLYDEIQKGERS